MTFIENILFKGEANDKDFKKNGIFLIKSSTNMKKIQAFCENTVDRKDYAILLVPNEKIKLLLNQIFTKELREHISYKTGFNYSIDYFRIYENRFQTEDTRLEHVDMSYSKNMLKIFIPLETNLDSGPLMIFDKNLTKLKQKGLKNIKEKPFLLTGDGENIYGVSPRICWHKEGNPKKYNSSIQMMFQLNPSNKWTFKKNIGKFQLKLEPKFTSLTSFLFEKGLLK